MSTVERLTIAEQVTVVWTGGCVFLLVVVQGLVLRLRRLWRREPGRRDRVGELAGVARASGYVGRHWAPETELGGDTAPWRPAHTRAAARRRGRHFTGSRCWSGNLVEHTREVSVEELAHALLAA